MRVVALLSWYDEDPEMLRDHVESWGKLCDAVIALDGAYRDLPGGGEYSSADQYEAIREGAKAAGMWTYIERAPREALAGNQISKRSRLFEIARQLEPYDGWWLSIDADEELALVPDGVRGHLRETSADAASVTVYADVPMQQPRLIRSQEITVGPDCHFQLVTADGRFLWGRPFEDEVEAWTRTAVGIVHRRERRMSDRVARQNAYYELRPEPTY